MKYIIKSISDKIKNHKNHRTLMKRSELCTFEKPLKIRGAEYIVKGRGVKIRANYRIECIDNFCGTKLVPNFVIGDNVIINNNFTAFVTCNLIIEKNTIIAGGVTIITENHGIDPLNGIPYMNQPLINKDVKIGKNVWLGQNTIILPGVSVGDYSIVGAGSVVTKDLPEFCIAVGNPCKVKKKFDQKLKKWVKVI